MKVKEQAVAKALNKVYPNIGELCSYARTMVRRHKVKLLVIDYLQLIPFDASKQSKNDAIAAISHKIKQLALELNVGILLLSQVNREGARREGGLAIYDLKDSGDIENDADVIISAKDKSLHRKFKGLSDNVVKEAFDWDDEYMKVEGYPQEKGLASGKG